MRRSNPSSSKANEWSGLSALLYRTKVVKEAASLFLGEWIGDLVVELRKLNGPAWDNSGGMKPMSMCQL